MVRQRRLKSSGTPATPHSDTAKIGSASTSTSTDQPSRRRTSGLSKADRTTIMDPVSDQTPLLGGSTKAASAKESRPLTSPSLSERHPSPHPESSGEGEAKMENLSRKSQWIVLAIASGGCAAFNGVFAKLTTTELTTNFATTIANVLGLGNVEGGVEVVVRAVFFGLNLIFNGIMWTLFTKALARGTSTTQVSILNTSSNFMLTAILGFLIFSESLPPLWFVGAALLVAGNVIIGRREEDEAPGKGVDEQQRAENGDGLYSSEDEGLLTGEEVELTDEPQVERSKKQEEDDILELDL